MPIKNLQLTNFRNLTEVNLNNSHKFNVLYGENGSGKTSLLEAIYYLNRGKSFRSQYANRIISHEADCFTIFAEFQQENQLIPLGIERNKDGTKRIKLASKDQQSIAPLTKLIPVQFMSTKSYRYFTDGPKLRRQYLDWGVFHVKHEFLDEWQSFQQILKQRNSALRLNLPCTEVEVWDNDYTTYANKIDIHRKGYINTLQPILFDLLNTMLPDTSFKLRYSRGWNKDLELADILQKNYHKDMQMGYTQSGPQRADLQLYVGNVPADDFLSQGQQKLASYALYLAQGMAMHKLVQQSPIYLIDDLPSELDKHKRKSITEALINLNSQVFITGISLTDLDDFLNIDDISLFHVKQGHIEEQI